jgi:hypothetical protein
MFGTEQGMTNRDRRFEEKRALEREICQILARRNELLGHQRYLLGEALGDVFSGRFGEARSAIHDVYKPSEEFSPSAIDVMTAHAIGHEALLRAAHYLEGVSARESPVFRWIS